MPIIYAAINNNNDKMYIGKTINTLDFRRRKHLELAKYGKVKSYFHKALIKHGSQVFDWIVLESCLLDDLNSSEKFWISYFKSIGAELYNLTSGGDGLLGYKHTNETKIKIANTLMGVKHTTERSKAIGDSLAKSYRFLDRDSVVVNITNLRRFCKEHNFDAGTLVKVSKGLRKSAYGFTQCKD